jgi:hypothetical protein
MPGEQAGWQLETAADAESVKRLAPVPARPTRSTTTALPRVSCLYTQPLRVFDWRQKGGPGYERKELDLRVRGTLGG